MIYSGTLHLADMEYRAKRAYLAWSSQKYRCYNPKCKEFKYYGAKGVQVKYSQREFIGWYLDQMNSKKLKRPSVSRLDHGGHYELGNIELVECGENTKEMLRRTGGNKRGHPVVLDFGDRTEVYRSMGYAAKLNGTSAAALLVRIRNRKKPRLSRREMKFEIYSMDEFLNGDTEKR